MLSILVLHSRKKKPVSSLSAMAMCQRWAVVLHGRCMTYYAQDTSNIMQYPCHWYMLHCASCTIQHMNVFPTPFDIHRRHLALIYHSPRVSHANSVRYRPKVSPLHPDGMGPPVGPGSPGEGVSGPLAPWGPLPPPWGLAVCRAWRGMPMGRGRGRIKCCQR